MLDTWTQSKNFIFKEELYVNAVIIPQHRQTHFKKERFALNFLTPQNASKFAIFMEKENPCSFFRFLFRATLSFTL